MKLAERTTADLVAYAANGSRHLYGARLARAGRIIRERDGREAHAAFVDAANAEWSRLQSEFEKAFHALPQSAQRDAAIAWQERGEMPESPAAPVQPESPEAPAVRRRADEEHGEKGHLNAFTRDHDSVVTAFGKHARVVAALPDHEGLYARVDLRWPELREPTAAEVLEVARKHQGVKGKWVVDSTRPPEKYESNGCERIEYWFIHPDELKAKLAKLESQAAPGEPQAPAPTHSADLNLDDEDEAAEFIETHGTLKGRALANRLGLSGKGSTEAATALSNYAWNKTTATACRKRGDIATAQQYDAICERIYSEDIQGKVACW